MAATGSAVHLNLLTRGHCVRTSGNRLSAGCTSALVSSSYTSEALRHGKRRLISSEWQPRATQDGHDACWPGQSHRILDSST